MFAGHDFEAPRSPRHPSNELPGTCSRASEAYNAAAVDDDADPHGRLRKKGGNQEMHFQGLRQANDCISTASDGHLCHGMLELLFLRRGACLRKKEKALFVSLATIRYLSRVCTCIHTSWIDHVYLGALWICYH